MDSFPHLPTALATLKRHRFTVALVFGSTVLGSILYLLLTPPIYQSSARIMLEEGNETVSDLGRALTQLESGPGTDPLATQSELITSEGVLSKALVELKTRNPGFPLNINDLETLKVRVIPATNILELNFSYTDPEVAATTLDAVVQSTADVNGEAIRQQASVVRKFLEEQLPRQETRLARAEAAETKFRQENGIVSLEDQINVLVGSLNQLENEELQVVAQIQEIQERASLLREVTGTNAIGDAYDSVRIGQDQVLSDLRDKLAEIESSIIEDSSRLGEQHPELQALLEQREGLRQLYQEKLKTIPGGTGLESTELSALNPLSQDLMAKFIADEIEYRSLNKRLSIVQTERATLEKRLAEIPVLSQPLASLVRQRQSAEEALQNIRRNLEEAQIAEAQLVSNIRILGRATIPDGPSAPSTPAVLVLGLVSGLVLSAGIIVLLESLDKELHSSEEAEAFLNIPLVGHLPAQPLEDIEHQDLENFLDNQVLISPYHNLLKAIEYKLSSDPVKESSLIHSAEETSNDQELFSPHNQEKVVLLSSAFWGEGKTTVISRLAAVSSMLGRKILIIDADLRYGFLSNYFKLNYQDGLVDVVQGNINLLKACHETLLDNIFVLPTGSLTNRPSSVIESRNMETVLREASQYFDLVILDAPPIAVSSDLITLSQRTKGLFLVMHPGAQTKYQLKRTISRFSKSGGNVLGLIFNESEIPPLLTESVTYSEEKMGVSIRE